MDTKPLLSDELLKCIRLQDRTGTVVLIEVDEIRRASAMAKEIEAALAEDAKLIQKLVDLIFHDSDCGQIMHNGTCDCFASVALSSAAARNFKPSQP